MTEEGGGVGGARAMAGMGRGLEEGGEAGEGGSGGGGRRRQNQSPGRLSLGSLMLSSWTRLPGRSRGMGLWTS